MLSCRTLLMCIQLLECRNTTHQFVNNPNVSCLIHASSAKCLWTPVKDCYELKQKWGLQVRCCKSCHAYSLSMRSFYKRSCIRNRAWQEWYIMQIIRKWLRRGYSKLPWLLTSGGGNPVSPIHNVKTTYMLIHVQVCWVASAWH